MNTTALENMVHLQKKGNLQLKMTSEKTPTWSEVRSLILAATAAIPSSSGLGIVREDFYCSGNMC